MFVADKTPTIHIYNDWDDCRDNKYCKNLNAILFDTSDATAEYWGYTAQKEYLNNYSDDSDDEETSVGTSSSTRGGPTKGKVLFKDFKSAFTKDINGTLEQDGFGMPVREVIVEYLSFVWELIMQQLLCHDLTITPNEIRWCFSVPVDWEESHKKEFRRIVSEARFIDEENCSLHDFMMVTESEAAAIYCIEKDQRKSLQANKTIMIVDVGASTVNLTVHQLDQHLKLKAMTISNCSTFALDDEFIAILHENFSREKLEKFKRESPLLYLEFMGNWENAKRGVKDIKKPLKLNVPPKLAILVSPSSLIDPDTLKLKLSGSQVERIFKKPLESIASQVKQQMKETKKTTRKPVDYIFLVGDFGQSEVLRKKLVEECETPETKIVMPKFSGEAVVNGATLLGKDPSLILTRRSKYTYGIEVEQVYQSSMHDENRCVSRGGEFVVPGVFKTYAKKGEETESPATNSESQQDKRKLILRSTTLPRNV